MFGQKKIPSRDGGAEVVVGNLSARLVKSGHIVTCFNRSTGHDDPKRSEFEGIELRTVYTVKKRGLSAAIGAFKAAWLAATGDYDVVHIHSEGPAAMSWLPQLAGQKAAGPEGIQGPWDARGLKALSPLSWQQGGRSRVGSP